MRATLLAGQARGSLRPVINATGVVIHTNLGRAPLADAAIERIASIARGYSNLEYDLDTGGRGSRTVHAESLITSITGAEAAIVVNNNAAAILLILSGLASGREVVISRGELVEIGGGFRVPDVMRQSGAALREVGTTNRTRDHGLHGVGVAGDGDVPARPPVELPHRRLHRAAVARTISSASARAMKVPVVEDIGSGCLVGRSRRRAVGAGVDRRRRRSGLLQRRQAARRSAVPASSPAARRWSIGCASHPLMRALRADKITFAVLEATLAEYAARPRRQRRIPVQRMLQDVRRRHRSARAGARRVARLADWRVAMMSGSSAVGGGSAPGLHAADGAARRSRGTANRPTPPNAGCARSTRP